MCGLYLAYVSRYKNVSSESRHNIPCLSYAGLPLQAKMAKFGTVLVKFTKFFHKCMCFSGSQRLEIDKGRSVSKLW